MIYIRHIRGRRGLGHDRMVVGFGLKYNYRAPIR